MGNNHEIKESPPTQTGTRLNKKRVEQGVHALLTALIEGKVTDSMSYLDAQHTFSKRFSSVELQAIFTTVAEAGLIRVEAVKTKTRPRRVIRVLPAVNTLRQKRQAEQEAEQTLIIDLARNLKAQYAL